jgi:hypothetical protein
MTIYEDLFDKFIRKINDPNFLYYANLTAVECADIIDTRCKNFLDGAIEELLFNSTPDIDFTDRDDVLKQFNFEISFLEQGLITDLMIEQYYEEDKSKLKAFSHYFSSKELQTFSPANERDSFLEMFKNMHNENILEIKDYVSKDRITGKPKTLNYNDIFEEEHFDLSRALDDYLC